MTDSICTDVIGMTEREAIVAVMLSANFGYAFRVVERDGVPIDLTGETISNRVNVTIVDGLITGAYLG